MQDNPQTLYPPLSDFIPLENVFVNLQFGSRKALFDEAATQLEARCPEITALAAFNTLFERERIGSTCLDKGIAIPHGQIAGLSRIITFLFHLREPIDFDATDGNPVELCFITFSPPEKREDYLHTLATIAAFCNNSKNIQAMQSCASKQSLWKTLNVQR
ncbi:MAG: PTS sugar transporter subunit IIA [Candidatus Eutrophobiaceae bacterium]